MADEKESTDIANAKSDDPSANNEDEELSALLDSALEDLTKPSKPSDKVESSQGIQNEVSRPTPPDTLWNEEFMRQTTARFEHNMHALFSPGADGTFNAEQLGENIQRLAEAASCGGETSPDTEFSAIIAQTLKNLSENTENIQNQLTDDDLMNMIGSFGNITDPNSDPNELLPFMQHMMQNLLSKDILYPALTSIIEKYPQWLDENKSQLSTQDYDRYSEQLRIMREVCSELDKESPSDSSEVKNSRFEQILALMQKMQDCGQPPAELAGDLSPMLNLDEHGNPQLPPGLASGQCNVM